MNMTSQLKLNCLSPVCIYINCGTYCNIVTCIFQDFRANVDSLSLDDIERIAQNNLQHQSAAT